MKAATPRRPSALLSAGLLTVAVMLAGCAGTSQIGATVNAPASSSNTSVERAATMAWFAATNVMWTKHDFRAVDGVTTGAIRTIYQHEATTTDGPVSHTDLTLDDLSITIPCQNTSPSVFVAYARTNVFTLGDGVQSTAMVFQQQGPTFKLAAAITHLDGKSWPALCQHGCPAVSDAQLAPSDYAAALARVLSIAAIGRAPTPSQAHPFAINSFLSGSGSITDQSATSLRLDHSAGDQFTSTFITTTNPTFALPLANNSGYWVIGTLQQHNELDSTAGVTAKSWPDGDQVDTPHPATAHHQTDDFLTTYTATDPTISAGSFVTLDGFFGWPITGAAS